ncbi:hypothetical protein HU200_030888 [Digitaria exilis]|uniref:RNA-dependent RNA polymerase n=1 Tax=Digitaria exilis TaxID=1010633 RepID=A0A835BQF6_9POAL|nr:hypothetical protein HU200_030888 [Digitaria exilis]
MRPSSSWPPPLPAAVGAELARLEARLGQTADPSVRAKLAELGDAAAARVLATVAASGDRVRTLSGFVVHLAKQEAMERNAAGIPTAESAACNSGPFRADDLAAEPDGMEVESPHRWISTGGLQNQSCFSPPVASPVSNRGTTQAGCHGYEYEMRGTLAQDHTPSPVCDITRRVQLLDGPAGRVVAATEFSPTTGNASRATEASEPSPQMIALGELEPVRFFLIVVYLAGGTKEISEAFFISQNAILNDALAGPYFDNTRTHLQKVVGDDNVLIVKFADVPGVKNSADNFGIYCMYYRQIAEDGIFLGLRRFALILSKTITFDVPMSDINVVIIDDELCKDEHGKIATDDGGEALIHTDGTGRISFDLAIKCPVRVFKGNFLKGHELQLPKKTIHIRPSMIKINADPTSLGGLPFNSLEVVTTSNRPRKSHTSRNLIALLLCGNVPAEYFIEILGKALEDANKTRNKAGDSLEVALNHADMDDLTSARMILAGIQPEDEAFLQYQLDIMTKEERKGFQEGKIPIDDCCYLMGTTDPTGTLKPDQVCVIHDNRQVSGKVLVYKPPGMHFGDIHMLNATHIDGLEEIVGNSKYAIIFPTSGSRSLADEMANSDFDGNMYWVSWNPQLLKHFKPGTPWKHKSQPKNTKQKKPQDYDGPELERLLFCEFLRARFSPSYVLGTAANCWLTLMDRFLTPEVSQSEKDTVKIHMLELVDIYYWALDAPKNGTKITIPQRLMVKKYPHFLEREPSYNSTSLLGWIYDEAKSQQSEPVLAITVSEDYKHRWTSLYHNEYLKQSSALCKIHYEAEEFEASPRSKLDLFSDACAIYQVVYEHAAPRNEVSKCGFAWKVAGRTLCELYLLKHGGETVTCLRSVLEDAFKKYRIATTSCSDVEAVVATLGDGAMHATSTRRGREEQEEEEETIGMATRSVLAMLGRRCSSSAAASMGGKGVEIHQAFRPVPPPTSPFRRAAVGNPQVKRHHASSAYLFSRVTTF